MESLEKVRLKQMVEKYEDLYSAQQLFFATSKKTNPQAWAEALNKSKKKEQGMLGFIKQLRFEQLAPGKP
jgi:hypothetical protein